MKNVVKEIQNRLLKIYNTSPIENMTRLLGDGCFKDFYKYVENNVTESAVRKEWNNGFNCGAACCISYLIDDKNDTVAEYLIKECFGNNIPKNICEQDYEKIKQLMKQK
jgi:hypothetical protein